jgi:Protein of unknown function (DUF4127)
MKIALLPLDERPANTRYPTQIAAIAGAELLIPPADLLPNLRQPANRAGLAQWLSNIASDADGVVASIDLIGHGGLIASRISDHSVQDVLQAIAPLTRLRKPNLPVFAFNVIQRISNANDNTEEPLFWGEYGVALYQYSRALDMALSGDARAQQDCRTLEAHIPEEHRQAWLARRLRNHTVNLAMLHAAAQDAFDLLVIPSDDTSPIGLSARERKHLDAMRSLTEVPSRKVPGTFGGAWHLSRVLMYPGADDLGSALVARMVNHLSQHTPKVFVHFMDERMKRNVAPYEDRPIYVAVETQLMAVGAQPAASVEEADGVLVVSPPFERIDGRDPHWRNLDPQHRADMLLPEVLRIRNWMRAGRKVAIADVAFPNGAEPALVELLFEHVEIAKLAAFGGWNTAGNTLGTVLGAACVPHQNDAARQTQLAHHLLEDWGYQSVVRNELRASPLATQADGWGAGGEVAAFTAQQLAPIAARIRTAGLPCAPTQVRHPWGRTFEVDFEL